MNIIICKNNGKYKRYDNNKKINPEEVKYVLIECKSSAFGASYVKVSPSTYRKVRKMRDIKLSYRFLNNSSGDPYSPNPECGDEPDWAYHTYKYKSFDEFMTKISEIITTENCLNELFWKYSSDFIYIFDILNLKYKRKGSKQKFKFKDLDNFWKDIQYGTEGDLGDPPVILMNDTNHTYEEKKFKSIVKNNDNQRILYKYSCGIYYEIDADIRDVFKHKVAIVDELKINYVSCEYEIDEDNTISSHRYEWRPDYKKDKLNTFIYLLLLFYFSREVCDRVSYLYDDDLYYIYKAKIKYKLEDEKIKEKISKFVREYFPGINDCCIGDDN